MIFRKDPIFKKLFLVLIAALAAAGSLLIINSVRLAAEMGNPARISAWSGYQGFIVTDVAAVLLLVIVNIFLFLAMGKYLVRKLDHLSFAADKIMDGQHPGLMEDEEGVFSRLESQFYQISRRMELGFEEIRKEKGKLHSLVTDISHQIKTPLSSIKVFNALLLEGGLSPQEEGEFLRRAKQQIAKLEWLSDALIKISKMETGMIELNIQRSDIKKTIIEAVNEVYLRARERNVEIEMQDLQNIPVCHDSKWTKEAIINILENSLKYSAAEGTVNVSMEKMESYIKINIKDSGIGIPSEEISKIFNRFYRGRAKKVAETEGSGIGLYLSRKLIEEQGGTIVAASPGEGRGSRFSILLTLPVKTD